MNKQCLAKDGVDDGDSGGSYDMFRVQIGGAQGIFEREKVCVGTETSKRGLGVNYAT